MGQQGNCPIPTVEGYLEHNKENFQSLVDRLIADNPEMEANEIMTINTIYNDYMKKNTVLADAFNSWAKDIYPNHVIEAGITSSLSPRTESEKKAILFVSAVSEEYISEPPLAPAMNDQESSDGEYKDDVATENRASTEVYADMSGEEVIKDIVFSAIGKRVSDKEYAQIVKFARENPGENGFESFMDYMVEKWPEIGFLPEDMTPEDRMMYTMFGEKAHDRIKDPTKVMSLKAFHNSFDPINKRTRTQKKYHVITNWNGKVAPKGDLYLIDKPELNLKTQRKEPTMLPASFIDTSPSKLPNGNKVGQDTEYMSLNDLVELTEKKDGTWFAKPSNFGYSVKQLNEMLKILARKAGLTIATLRGGNSGMIVLTKIEHYYNNLFPQQQIEVLAAKFPEKFQKYLKTHNNNMMKAVLNYYNDLVKVLNTEGVGRAKEEVAIANAILKAHSEIAIVNYKKYMQEQLDKKLITPEKYEEFIQNIFNLPLEGTKDSYGLNRPYIFMGEYLASIIARHEWLKAVIGKDYVARGKDVEDIFNRMRLPLSEGSMNRDGTDSETLILDESNIQYRNTETGEIIEVNQNVGLKDDVPIDDGALDMSSRKMDEHTASLGRQATRNYEHNPRELKIAHYDLVQNEDGQDDYMISKQMAFVAEPGLEIIDKNTGKVLARYVKNPDGSISIKAGPGTNIAGKEIDEVMTLNENKDSTGKYSIPEGESYVHVTLPAQATRTVILPATKSHNDAALGTTWANTFNQDTPAANAVREILFKIYTDIMNKHLNILHRARVSPDSLRKLVRYHYKVLNDATTEVQQLINMSDKGVHHPNNLKIFRTSIFNMLIASGALKGRITIDRTKPNSVSEGMSSTLKLKQDKMGRIKLGEDGEAEGIISGVDNDRLLNYVQDKYLQEILKKEQIDVQAFRDLSLEERIGKINSFLESNDIMVQVTRQPIQHKGGLLFRKLLKFEPNAGNQLIMHVRDVAFHLLADADGDTVSIAILPKPELAKELMNAMKSDAFLLENFTADLNIFEHAPKTSPASYVGFTESMVSSIQFHAAQGVVSNIKTIASVMEMKLGDNPIKLNDGTSIKIVKADDFIIMDYAPLLDSVTQADIPEFASIVNADGTPHDGKGPKYLRTTANHERLLLINAATDNTKEHLLGKMWNMDYNKLVARMYKREDGQPLTKPQIQLLKKLNKFFNYSDIRRGRNKQTGRKLTDSEFYNKTKGILNFLNNSPEGKVDIIKNLIKLPNKKLSIEEITISDKMTADELLVTKPAEKMEKDSEEMNKNTKMVPWGYQGDSPMSYTDAKYQNTHFTAMQGFNNGETVIKGLNDIMKDILSSLPPGDMLTDEARTAAKNFLNRFDPAWRAHLNKKREARSKSKNELTSQHYDYDKEMHEFMQPWLKEMDGLIEKHGEVFRMVVTYFQFKGFGGVKRMNLLYKSDMLNGTVYDAYMTVWEKLFFAIDKKNGQYLISSTKAKTTADQRVADITEGNQCG
jgi:hypothetical protein